MLAISALCGVAFGYAAQRGSLCVVSGIEALLEGRSPRVFLSFLRCSVWVIAVTLPIAWIVDGDQFDRIAAPSLATVLAGFAFGVGAAINGGCAFGTLNRLGGGDLSFVATLAGLCLGILIQQSVPAFDVSLRVIGPSPLEMPMTVGLAVMIGVAAICLRELANGRSADPPQRGWHPERAALVMGLAGGILYAVHGAWAYTIALERGVSVMRSGGIPDLDLAIIFGACLMGAAVAARGIGRYRIWLNARAIPTRLLGGAIMGVASASVPGGNDALILHALPALSAHAPVAYLFLVLGATTALAVSSGLRRQVAV